MLSEAEIKIIKDLRAAGKTFQEITDILNLSRSSVTHLYYYDRRILKAKRGPKKIRSFEKLRIKRRVAQYKKSKEKVNATKIKRSRYLQMSTRSIQRHFKSEGYRYTRAKSEIILTRIHKESRLEKITNWITSSHPCERTVFTDEKRFSFGGPDDWRTYVPPPKSPDINIV